MSKGVFLVTGGSRGIGEAIARDGAAAGYHVLLTYASRADTAEAVVASIRAAGGKADAVQANTGKGEDIVRMFQVADAIGPLSVFVYNGGIVGAVGRLEDQPDDMLAEVIAVNLTGAMIACREAVRRMSTRFGGKGGAIVLISSLAARIGAPNRHLWYAASKGGVNSLALGLSKEVAADGVRVNVVSPGPINSEIHPPGHLDRIRDVLPTKRIGEPEEVSAAVMFLASDKASYVIGEILEVGGGV